jgi:hypothetical protein
MLCLTFGALPSVAAEHPPLSLIDDRVISSIRDILQRPVVLISVRAQNRIYKDLAQADIDRLDKDWRAEREAEDQPLIASVMSSPLSTFLTLVQAQNQGLFSEIFVMDRNGLNVGQGAVTSDYWQGDEAKFQKTYSVGPEAVFIDEPELNEEFGTWRVQVNMTISDAGEKIGAATFEVNLNELERRSAAKQ